MLLANKLNMETDFPLMCEWFREREFPAPVPEYLPPDGLMVLSDAQPICGGFLFKTNANIAIIGHLVSDKKVDFQTRSKALDYLLMSLQALAKKEKFELVVASTNLPRLMERFEKLGLTKTDESVSQFGRVL